MNIINDRSGCAKYNAQHKSKTGLLTHQPQRPLWLPQENITHRDRALDGRFFEDPALTQLRGRYFNFGRNNRTDVAKNNFAEAGVNEIDEFRKNPTQDLHLVWKSIKGRNHPTRPGANAYRVWHGLTVDFRHSLGHCVQYTTGKLTQLGGGIEPGGGAYTRCLAAADELRATEVHAHTTPWLRAEVNEYVSFNLISELRTEANTGIKQLQYLNFEPSPVIASCYKSTLGCYSYNTERFEGLEPPEHCFALTLMCLLTKRYFAEREKAEPNFVMEKNYSAICRDMLGGVKPINEKSRLQRRHLHKRTAEFVERGILSCQPEVRRGKDDWVVIFRPAESFINDCNAFYESRKKTSAINPDTEVLALLDIFKNAKFKGKMHRQFNNKEMMYTIRIHEEMGTKRATDFFKFALLQSNRRWQGMDTVVGLNKYIGEFEEQHPIKDKSVKARKNNASAKPTDKSIPDSLSDYTVMYGNLTFNTIDAVLESLSDEKRGAYDGLSVREIHQKMIETNVFVNFNEWMQQYRTTSQQPAVFAEQSIQQQLPVVTLPALESISEALPEVQPLALPESPRQLYLPETDST